ncbi:MAG: hypothetical protein WC686_00025 [Candidatus Shapirobacteria bacterium]|jgi:hypothetical protein
MAKKKPEQETPARRPLRHGWGGDLKRRNQALRRREEDAQEAKELPVKFGEGTVVADEKLLKEMERRR